MVPELKRPLSHSKPDGSKALVDVAVDLFRRRVQEVIEAGIVARVLQEVQWGAICLVQGLVPCCWEDAARLDAFGHTQRHPLAGPCHHMYFRVVGRPLPSRHQLRVQRHLELVVFTDHHVLELPRLQHALQGRLPCQRYVQVRRTVRATM